MADEKLQILIEIREQLRGLQQTTREFREAKTEARAFGDTARVAFGTFTGNVASRGAAMLHNQVRNLVVSGFQYTAQLEQQTLAFRPLLGSMEAAVNWMSQLEKFSTTTPFRQADVIGASRTLQVYGREQLNNLTMLTRMGDAAAVANVDLARLADWVGRLYSALEAGEPIGMAVTELRRMGVVTTEVIDQLRNAPDAASGVQVLQRHWETFGGAMEEQSKSISGLLSTAKDRAQQLAAAFVLGEEGSEDLKSNLEDIVKILNDPATMEAVKAWGETFRTVAGWMGWAADRFHQTGQGLGMLAGAAVYGWDEVEKAYAIDMGVIEKSPSGQQKDDKKDDKKAPPEMNDQGRMAMRQLDLSRIRVEMAKLESDELTTQAGKRQRVLDLLAQEAAILPDLNRMYAEMGDKLWDEGNFEGAVQFWERAEEASLRQIVALNEISGMESPFRAGLVEWLDSFDAIEDRAVNLFTGTLDPFTRNFGQSMVSELRRSGDAMQGLQNIGMAMFDNFLAQLLNYTMQWAVTQLLVKTGMVSTETVATGLRAKRMAATQAEGAANTAAHGPGALMASIGSFGMATIIGVAALVAAMAAFGSFSEGGWTGPGGKMDVAGIVHADEYVLNKDVVRALGVPALDTFAKTGSLPSGAGGGSGSSRASMAPASGDQLVKEVYVTQMPGQRKRQIMDDPSARYEFRRFMSEEYGI